MARRANFINEYGEATPEKRTRMIFLNYSAFPDIIKGYEQKMIIRIRGEIDKAHRDEIGNLGVRVQGGGMPSSPVERIGNCELEIEAAIKKNKLPDSLLVDYETAEDHIRDCNILYMMRRDLGIVNAGIVMLGSRDASILRDALAGVSMVEIGDRVNMSEHTIRNMVSAMKSDLREQLAYEYENNKWEV